MNRTPLGGTGKSTGRFVIEYDPHDETFIAEAEGADGIYRKAEVAYSLDELMRKCASAGLTELEGLSDAATNRVYRWLTVERPVDEYMSGLWGSYSGASKGPQKRRFGFRTPQDDD